MRITLVVLVLVLAAGCGGGSKNDSAGPDKAAGADRYSSAADVAKAAGCSPTEVKNADLEYFVTNAVTCPVNGHDVTVEWFKTTQARNTYKKTADGFGGAALVYGPDFAVECQDDQADCTAFMDSLK